MKHQIAKLVRDGLYKEALKHYTQLHNASIHPTKFTFAYLLKACAQLKDVSHAEMLHAHLVKSGYRSMKHITTDLTNMYMKLQLVGSAAKLFNEMRHPNLSILNVMVSGFSQNGHFKQGFGIFKVFSVRNFKINSVTVAGVLSGCENILNGVQVHCLAIKIGVEMDTYVATSLITMYWSCGEFHSATKLFLLTKNKNVVCYNAHLSGLVHNEVVEEVFSVYNEMRASIHVKPNIVTMLSVLSASANGRCLRFGRELHAVVVKAGLDFNTNVGTTLVDMYSKCGSWTSAYIVFTELGTNRNLVTWNSMIAGMLLNNQKEDAISLFTQIENEEQLKPDLVTWNSMISGFSQLGNFDEALLFFRKMQCYCIVPNVRCITSLLAACSSQSMLRMGKQIHGFVERVEVLDDEFLATAIIDMYMKCGQPRSAEMFFDQFKPKPNSAAMWNTMISGFGRNGKSEEAFDIFNRMVEKNVKPTLATVGCLLSVCSKTGQVEKGIETFALMTVKYGLIPRSDHWNILIDLLSRSGKLDEAIELLEATNESSPAVFSSLLGACKDYSNPILAEEMAKRLSEISSQSPIPYVILSNIYAGHERWKDVREIRKLMDVKGLKKDPARSSTGFA